MSATAWNEPYMTRPPQGAKDFVNLQAKYYEVCRKSEECTPLGKELEACQRKLKDGKIDSCWKQFMDFTLAVNKCGLKSFALSEEVNQSVNRTARDDGVLIALMPMQVLRDSSK